MGLTCSFCSSDLTKSSKADEHVIPHWLLNKLEIESHETHTAATRHGDGEIVQQKSFGARSIIYGIVCASCNNGWLSSLESATKVIFDRLLSVKKTQLVLSINETKTLAFWSYKTAMLLLSTADDARKALISTEALSSMYERQAPPQNASIAVIKAISNPVRKAETVIRQPDFIATEPEICSRDRFIAIHRESVGFVVMLQFGHLILRVVCVSPRKHWQIIDRMNVPFQSLRDGHGTKCDWPPLVWPGKTLYQLAEGIEFRLILA